MCTSGKHRSLVRTGNPQKNLRLVRPTMADLVQILPVTMTSLPIPTYLPQSGLAVHPAAFGAEDEQFLLRAFHTFSQAAASLETSYGELRIEVERLRRELEESHAELARSLEENRGIRAHLDRILEALPCGVVVVSGQGEIMRLNPKAQCLLGFEQGLSGAGQAGSLSGEVKKLFDRARNAAAAVEMPVSVRGARTWLEARHATLAEDDGSSVFILQDVSERKRLEQAQQKLRREQALVEMSAVLAHEIRNPLGSMELFAGLLAESPLDPDSKKWVEHVQAGLRTLSATVNNVLQFHSLPEPERAPLDVGELLTWARGFLQPLARQAGIALSLQNGLAGVTLLADRHRLEQVLLNLVLNAIHAMPGGGWIQLAGRVKKDGAVTIEVCDTGPGISPEHLGHIFDPGFSTHPASPGLGLAVCRKIVEQHGGQMVAESSPGAGARFSLIFPLNAAPVGDRQT
jgi:two-component system sensor histidine kinase FlrB